MMARMLPVLRMKIFAFIEMIQDFLNFTRNA